MLSNNNKEQTNKIHKSKKKRKKMGCTVTPVAKSPRIIGPPETTKLTVTNVKKFGLTTQGLS